MKKLALTALAAMIAATGFATTASAGSRNNDDEWRQHSDRDGGDREDRDWNGRDDARRDRDRDDEWRRHGHRDHWRHHHNRRHVYRYDRYDRDFCFVKKIRRYDDWGNVYIKRVRICR
jgi:Ni/Co efflux regulator RcnB